MWNEDCIWSHPAHPGYEVLWAIFKFPRSTASFRNPSERFKGERCEKAQLEGLRGAVEGEKEIWRKICTKLKPWGNQVNLKAKEAIQSIKRIGDCHKNSKRNATKIPETGTRVSAHRCWLDAEALLWLTAAGAVSAIATGGEREGGCRGWKQSPDGWGDKHHLVIILSIMLSHQMFFIRLQDYLSL